MSMRKEVVVPFDTLAYAKKLEMAGVEVKQAEVHAEALAEVLEGSFVNKTTWDHRLGAVAQEMVALRTDLIREVDTLRADVMREIDTLRREMKQEIQALRDEMNAKFADFKVDIIKWVFSISFAQAAVIISALKFFPA